MGLSISNSLANAATGAANTGRAAARAPQTDVNNSEDTVKLTAPQQVVQLYNQGQSISQIASTLSLPVQTVNTYLGITSDRG
jgi:DNA-binding NarL/FixJ family response regulator